MIKRRTFLQGAAAAIGTVSFSSLSSLSTSAQGSPKIVIGYSPITAGLPFFTAIERGFFKQLNLNVEAVRFPNPQQIIEGMIAGRIQGSANGVPSGSLMIGEAASPNLIKIINANPSNASLVLDQMLVAANSPIRSIKDLQGKRIGCGPGPQNLAVARGILAANGIKGVRINQLPLDQHIAALKSGSLDAVYTLEPTGTIGRLAKATRVLETGVVSRYILGDPQAPWFGGSATLSTGFIKANPQVARRYLAAYRRGVEEVRKNPTQARLFLDKYTPLKDELARTVPLPGYKMYDEMTPADIRQFQKFANFLRDQKILRRDISVASLMLKGSDI